MASLAVGIRGPFLDHGAARGTRGQVHTENLRQNSEFAWCRRMLRRFRLPPTVHHHAHYRAPIGYASGGSTTSTSGLTGRSGRSWTTCTTTQWSAPWWKSPETGRGRAGDFTIYRTAQFWPWTGCPSRIHGKTRHVCATHEASPPVDCSTRRWCNSPPSSRCRMWPWSTLRRAGSCCRRSSSGCAGRYRG